MPTGRNREQWGELLLPFSALRGRVHSCRLTLPSSSPDRGTFLTKKQDQAARKIMRFLRRCRHRYSRREGGRLGEAEFGNRGH